MIITREVPRKIATICYLMGVSTLLAGMSSLNALAADSYAPPVTIKQIDLTFTVHKNGSYESVYEVSRLIETDEGATSHGDIDISYIPKLESVNIIEACTILPNGKIIKVPQRNIRTTNDERERGGSSYSDGKHKVIIFPNVVVGSQLYYKYSKVVHTPIFAGQFEHIRYVSPFFKFQHFQINYNIDPGISIQFDSKGFEGGKLPDKNGIHRYSFTYRQESVLPPESGQIEIDDFAPFVQATTYQNYEAFGSAYELKAKPKVRVTTAIQKLADDLTVGVDDKKEQIRILYNWVAKNIRYVGSYIGNGGFVPHDSQEILENKWGDCKDHVVILGALLAAKRIDSSPALINTNHSYVLPRLTTNRFNHVITYVPSINMYLDSTNQFAPFGNLPADDLDKQVILTGLNRLGKTPPMQADGQKTSTSIWLKVLPDGRIQGTSHTTSTGDFEISERSLRFVEKDEPQEQVTNSHLKEVNLTGVGQLNSTDPTDLDKPLVIDSIFTLDPISKFPGPAAMFIPAGLSFGTITGTMLPKPKAKMNFPEFCESFSYSNHFEIEFPPSVKIRNIPDNVNYMDDSTRYTSTYTQKGNKVEVSRELISQHPSMVCGEAENEMDKKFFPIFQRDMLAQIIYE